MYSVEISSQAKKRIIDVSAVLIIIFVAVKQIGTFKTHFLQGEENAWVYLFPNSFCSFSALFLGIFTVKKRTNASALYFLCLNTLVGCIPSVVAPDYLYSRPFFAFSTIASLLYHALAVWVVLALTTSGFFKPTYKKFYRYPVGFVLMIVFGYFLVYVTGSDDAMNITKPLISGWNPTYWYGLFPVCCLGALGMIWILSKISPKITQF